MPCGNEDKINCHSLKYKQKDYSMRNGTHIQTQIQNIICICIK